MKPVLLYENEKEEKQHMSSIHTLAEEIKIPEEDVGAYYAIILKRYVEFATVRIYLPIIVKRKVKETFLKRKQSKSFYGITNPFRSEK